MPSEDAARADALAVEAGQAAGCCHAAPEDAPGYHPAQTAYLRRLRLIEGQVRGLQRMVEADTYCIDVLTQVSAVKKALESLSLSLADDHIHHCVQHAAASGDEAEIAQKLDEVMTVMKRLLK